MYSLRRIASCSTFVSPPPPPPVMISHSVAMMPYNVMLAKYFPLITGAYTVLYSTCKSVSTELLTVRHIFLWQTVLIERPTYLTHYAFEF